MPSFDELSPPESEKILLIGNSGAGKTGSVIALAALGLNVRILDLDKGVAVIKGLVLDPDSPYRHDSGRANALLPGWLPIKGLWSEELGQSLPSRISYVTMTETMTAVNLPNRQIKAVPKGDLYARIVAQFDDWRDGEKSLGPITSWGPNDVLVIDGLTRFSEAIFTQQLAIGGRLINRPEQSDYGNAQRELRRALMTLYAEDIKCNVIMICHIDFIETESGPTKGFSKVLVGKSFAPEVGTYFNHTLLAQSIGQGAQERRVIKTNTSGMVELKTAVPLRAKPEYPLPTGLAEYFKAIRGSRGF